MGPAPISLPILDTKIAEAKTKMSVATAVASARLITVMQESKK